jgi:YVTN family beta-propeller protein
MRLRLRSLVLSLLLVLAGATFAASRYHLIKKIPLGGEGGWDYLTFDPGSGRLYIARATHVIVLDTASGKVAGDIPDTAGVHGIAPVPEFGRGFTSNGRAGTVTIFDLKTLAVIGHAKTGENPDAIVYDPASKRVFAMNGRSGDATAIDAGTGKVAGTVPLGGKPEFAVADGRGRIYVNIEDKSEMVALDSQKLAVVARWPLAPCEEPTGLALDPEHRRLFVGCSNKLMAVVDADGGKVITTLPIGSGVDATAFDPGLRYAYASNGEGTLTVVHEDEPDKFTVVENVTTQRGARTMALDPSTHQVYLVTADLAPTPPSAPGQPRKRPAIVPDTFVVLVFGK